MMLRFPTTLAVAALTLVAIGEASAHEASADTGRLCNPVQDRTAAALITRDGRFVTHGDTFDCPKPEKVVANVEPAPPPPPTEPVIIASIASDVAFDLNKAVLKPDFYGELDRIIATLKQSPETKFEIVGHADSTGATDYNQGLSERRAGAVADYLVRHGVEPSRFTTSGRGEMDPVASNKTKEGRAQNRRVDIQSMS